MWFGLSVHDWQQKGNEKTMKKTEGSNPTGKASDDMLSEYKFDYSKARPNRFASRIQKEGVMVTLDPDVSEVFTTSESVNTVLRALIETMPQAKGRKPADKRPSS
jgi:hypothetical protein